MKRIVIVTVAAAAFTAGAWAQSSEVGQRAENQQDRVAQGVKSGSLTAGETANIETKESAINQEVRTDRSLNGGHLTGQEKQTVNQQQNQMSRQIYADKHNAAVQKYGNDEVDARRENQQDRIANGIASGKLKRGEDSASGKERILHQQRSSCRPFRQRRQAHPRREAAGQPSAEPHEPENLQGQALTSFFRGESQPGPGPWGAGCAHLPLLKPSARMRLFRFVRPMPSARAQDSGVRADCRPAGRRSKSRRT